MALLRRRRLGKNTDEQQCEMFLQIIEGYLIYLRPNGRLWLVLTAGFLLQFRYGQDLEQIT